MTNHSSTPKSPPTPEVSPNPPAATAKGADQLKVIGVSRFTLEGDVHKLVTFLNQTLKDKGFIFGLTKDPESFTLKIYQTDLSDS